MTTPPHDGQIAQVLIELGKLSTDVAVIKDRLQIVSDHEARIRVLESAKAKIIGAGVASGALSGAVATIVYWALSRHG